MTETEWRNGYAVLRGHDINGKFIDATERVSFKYKLVEEDGETRLDLDRIVHVGPVERSAATPELVLFNAEDNEVDAIKPFAWFQPPPGAGRIGGYITVTPGQEVHT